jgi:hypothetical protein
MAKIPLRDQYWYQQLRQNVLLGGEGIGPLLSGWTWAIVLGGMFFAVMLVY